MPCAPRHRRDPLKAEVPRDYVRRIAGAKLAAVEAAEDEVVLCADTTVALGRRILGKPVDEAEAGATLRLLSGAATVSSRPSRSGGGCAPGSAS
jgi:septum formation protein